MSVFIAILKNVLKGLGFGAAVVTKASIATYETSKELYPEAVRGARQGWKRGLKFEFKLPELSVDDSDDDQA